MQNFLKGKKNKFGKTDGFTYYLDGFGNYNVGDPSDPQADT